MQKTQTPVRRDDEKLQNLDNILQQLEVETFEIEDIAEVKVILGTSTSTSSCCSSTTSSNAK